MHRTLTTVKHNLDGDGALSQYISLLRSAGTLQQGRCLHDGIIRHGFDQNTVLQSSLVQMYGNYGALEDARSAFSNSKHSTQCSWSSLIAAYTRNHHAAHAIALFDQMRLQSIIPRKVTLISLLSALSSQEFLPHGIRIHGCIIQYGFESDIIVATAIVNMYSKCGSLEDAKKMFDSIPNRDVVLWTAMISAYAKHGRGKDALELFSQMLQDEVIPDAITFASIINACSSCPTLEVGQLREKIKSAGFDSDIGVGTALLNLYVKRGNMIEAREMFDKLPKQNLITWNSMLALYARLQCDKEALQLFNDMLREGLTPDAITFVAILQVFSSQSALANVKQMHVRIIATQLVSNVILATSLMNMYGKCRSLEDALRMLDCILNKNVIVWSAIIAVLTQHGLGQEALQSFYRMQQEGILPNDVTFASSLDACTIQRILARGKQMHACLVVSGSMSNLTMITALVNLYGKCGNLDHARNLFEEAHEQDVVLWTAMISAYAMHGQGKLAVQLFNQMQEEGVAPNKITVICILDACSSLSALAVGKHIHACIGDKEATSKVDMGTALVNMYAKCGSAAYARRVFDAVSFKDTMSWTAIISAYAHNGDDRNAVEVFEQMVEQRVMPDSVTFLSIMSACSHSGLVDLGIRFFISMKQDFGLTPIASHYDCIIDLLGRSGQLNKAEHLVNNLPVEPTGVSWTTLLGACRDWIDIDRGERLAQRMFDLEPQGAASYVALSNMYAAAGRIDYSVSEVSLAGA